MNQAVKRLKRFREPIRRAFVVIFCLVALTDMITANFTWNWRLYDPTPYSGPVDHAIRKTWWLMRSVGSVIGADNSWQMFSTLHKFDWHLTFTARSEDKQKHIFPIPYQSFRSPAQRFFFDGRIAKLYLNLYANAEYRKAYARYLCARYEPIFLTQLKQVEVDLIYRHIPAPPWRPEQKLNTGVLAEGKTKWETIPCAL